MNGWITAALLEGSGCSFLADAMYRAGRRRIAVLVNLLGLMGGVDGAVADLCTSRTRDAAPPSHRQQLC